MVDSLKPQAGSDPLLGEIRRRGWPSTKAAYVALLLDGQPETFPLDPELEAQVPDWLPGDLPSSPMDLMFPVPASSLPTSPSGTRPTDERQLPEPLIVSVMERHGFTRNKAIEQILKSGG